MKKLIYLIVLALILGLVLTGCLLSNVGQVPATEQSGIAYLTKGTPKEIKLYAGQHIDVGTVTVSDDGTDLTVTYNTTDGWVMTETHLAIAGSLEGIPQTGKGNPIPGKFEHSMDHDPAVTVYTYTIPITWEPCIELSIAAHAVVVEQLTDGGCATSVYDDDQGTQKGGGEIGSGRDDPDNALGDIDKSFFSLGFIGDAVPGGWIILEFEDYVGTSLNVIEQSPGTGWNYPLEQAKVYVSADSEGPWTDLGMANNQITGGSEKGQSHENVFDLEECIKFVKIVDQTDPTLHSGNADAFDFDAVCGGPCYQEETETAWGDGYRFVDQGNWATYFNYTVFVKEVYSFINTQPVNDGTVGDLVTTVAEDGDWMVWTFDFPVEKFTGNGNLNVGLIVALDGEGNGPAFQIHNNDGTDSGFAVGTWLYSEWGPTISDGWMGWHSGDTNTLVTSLSWVEAIGQRNTPWEGLVSGDGVMEIRIKKSELGCAFHWAASPKVGSGFFAPAYDVTMQIPAGFGWGTPLVNMVVPNYVAR